MLLSVVQVALPGRERPLLEDISFEHAAGQLLAVIGPNGAGKSTLLRALAGDQPVQGQIALSGRALNDYSIASLATRLAMLSQEQQLGFPFTVREVIALGRLPHSSGAEEDQRIVAEVAARFALDELLERVYTRLSGGEKQRVQIARCVAQLWPERQAAAASNSERLLLLDEPTASLDIAHQRAVLEQLRTLTETGLGIVVVLHDINLALNYADQLLVLQAGRLVASGKPAEIINPELLKSVYAVDIDIVAGPDGRRIALW